jgi:hypothetical protein
VAEFKKEIPGQYHQHMEGRVTKKCFWRGVLIVVLSLVLAAPAKARGFPSVAGIVAAIVGVAAAVVVVIVVVIHESIKKRAIITGCVKSGENGMSVTDEKDRRIYALAGNTAGIKPGDRVTLQGKKIKSKGANEMLAWEVKKEVKDFGACQP